MKKKIIKLFGCVLLVIFLTGCEKTYLSCSKTLVDNDTLKINKTIKLGYKKADLVNSNVYYDYKFKNENSTNLETMKKELNEECGIYKNMDGVSCNVSNIDNGLHFELSLEIDKVSEKDAVQFEEMINYGSYTDTKNELSKEYVCN